jgi:carboxymethylenebutenolidase
LVKTLMAREDVRPGGVGVVGYCFGGGMAWRLATKDPNVLAAAPHYGSAPPLADVPNIKAKVLALYAEDDNITRNFPSLEEVLRSAGVNYEAIVYPGTRHAFHNDTGQSYNAEAAKDAYARTVALFKATLPNM